MLANITLTPTFRGYFQGELEDLEKEYSKAINEALGSNDNQVASMSKSWTILEVDQSLQILKLKLFRTFEVKKTGLSARDMDYKDLQEFTENFCKFYNNKIRLKNYDSGYTLESFKLTPPGNIDEFIKKYAELEFYHINFVYTYSVDMTDSIEFDTSESKETEVKTQIPKSTKKKK